MMKKTLTALAVMSAGVAMTCAYAANVEMYGVIDTGLTFTHISDGNQNKLEMNSGNYAGPRVGLRGKEDLGNGVAVGFILESGFSSDTGKLGQNGGIFGREAQVYVKGDWGTVGMGRVGAFSSGSSSLGWYWDMEPFETGYTDAGVQATQVNVWRLDSNTVYYVSPTFAGTKLGLQYSFTGTNDEERPEFSDNDSFFNAALRWDGANARAIAAFEWERAGQREEGFNDRRDDAFNVKLAGACQPAGGPATFYLGASFYKNYSRFSDSTSDDDEKILFGKDGERLEGWSAFAGAKYTIGSADLLALIQYLDGENKNPDELSGQDTDYSRTVASIGCHYHVSKRTMLYGIGSYAKGTGLFKDLDEAATDRVMVHAGLTHFF